MVHRLENDYWGQVDFVYLDIENPNNYQALREKFGNVNTIPSFYILTPDGSFVYHWLGLDTEQSMRQKLNTTLQSYPSQTTTQNTPVEVAKNQLDIALRFTYYILSQLQ